MIEGNRRDRDDGEPDAHHRPEKGGDTRRAARLHRKQGEQDDDRQRHHIGIERRGDELVIPSIAESTETAGVITASP